MLEHRVAVDGHFLDHIGLGALVPGGAGGIGIEGGGVVAAGREEIEREVGFVAVVACGAAHIPFVLALGFAGGEDIFAGFGGQIEALVPVEGHILDELEGIGAGLIVFDHVSGHLQGAVERDVEGQLTSQGGTHVTLVVGAHLLEIHHEDARGVVHRSADAAGEGEDGGVVDGVAAERLVLCAARTLVGDEVGVGSAQTGGACGLVGVDHDVVVGGLLHGIEVVVVQPLAVVVLSAGDDVAHIAALDGVVAVVDHEAVGGIEMSLIVAHRRGGFVVHDELHAARLGIFVEFLDVEVGIGGDEVEDIVLLVPEPVLPSLVPTLDEHGIESVFGGKVDVSLHIGRVGRVFGRGGEFGVVGFAEFHTAHGVGVGPLSASGDHVPPHAHVFHGVNPRGVVDFGGFVEVEGDAAGENVGGFSPHDDGSPRRIGGRLQVALVAARIGGEVAHESVVLLVVGEVHGGIVHTGGLVEVDIQAVGGAHLQRGLHGGGPGGGAGRGGLDGLLHPSAYAGEFRLLVFELLGVVVAGHPPGGVVARHGKFRQLVGHDKVGEFFLIGELIAETESVVEEAEADVHEAIVLRLFETHEQFVVVIANAALLAQHGSPRLVEAVVFVAQELEAAVAIGFLLGVLVLGHLGLHLREGVLLAAVALEFVAKMGGSDDGSAVDGEGVGGSTVVDAEVEFHFAVGRGDLLRVGGEDQEGKGGSEEGLLHFVEAAI